MINFEVKSERSPYRDQDDYYYVRGGYYKTRAEAEEAKLKLEQAQCMHEKFAERGRDDA